MSGMRVCTTKPLLLSILQNLCFRETSVRRGPIQTFAIGVTLPYQSNKSTDNITSPQLFSRVLWAEPQFWDDPPPIPCSEPVGQPSRWPACLWACLQPPRADTRPGSLPLSQFTVPATYTLSISPNCPLIESRGVRISGQWHYGQESRQWSSRNDAICHREISWTERTVLEQ